MLQQIDLDNYFSHRRRLTEIQAINKVSDGGHIVKINKSKQELSELLRNMDIERHNKHLYD
jgi:hypothetical protein